jgi:hypothetical protein
VNTLTDFYEIKEFNSKKRKKYLKKKDLQNSQNHTINKKQIFDHIFSSNIQLIYSNNSR